MRPRAQRPQRVHHPSMHWRLCCVAVPLRAIRGTQALDGPPAGTRSGTPELRLEPSGYPSLRRIPWRAAPRCRRYLNAGSPRKTLSRSLLSFLNDARASLGDHAARLRRVQVQKRVDWGEIPQEDRSLVGLFNCRYYAKPAPAQLVTDDDRVCQCGVIPYGYVREHRDLVETHGAHRMNAWYLQQRLSELRALLLCVDPRHM